MRSAVSYRNAPPRAGAMIEALRGLGYSTATALADLVDNSIAAGAGCVNLQFVWAGLDSHIIIQDDGRGMDDAALDRAMRLGHQSPLDTRADDDLGRFGLGLKTASFSQCRRLTVASRRAGGSIACLRWDLDLLASSDDDTWRLLIGPADESRRLLEPLQTARHGTRVLWEHLDRIVTPGFSEQNFLDLIDGIETHLAMVFHRYLSGKHPGLRIAINDRAVKPWDPFLTTHHATWSSPTEVLAPGVAAQCHVLPHKDRLDPGQQETAAGPDGWTAQQGFYVYRNQRLLVAGSWLGLGRGRPRTKEEAHRLARIRLDIPNSADAEWKIDIRKSTARPPVALRQDLTHLMEDTCQRARRVFAHRGRIAGRTVGGPVVQAWRAEHRNDGMRYRIDTSHPAVAAVLDNAGALDPQIRAMIRVVEATVPVQRIWLDTTEGRETPRTGFGGVPDEEIRTVARVLFDDLVRRQGLTPDLARERLLRTEPFHDHPDLVAALPIT